MMSEEVRVRDVMSTDVVTVTPATTVVEFLELARRREISGAPVVDEEERVLGVVSLTDVLRSLRGDALSALGRGSETGSSEPARAASTFFHVTDSAFRVPAPEVIPETSEGRAGASRTVREIMTRATVSVGADVGIGEAADFLDRAGVHRALVFESARLAGIVTTHDLIGALLAEE